MDVMSFALTPANAFHAPFPPHLLALRGNMYTPSVSSVQEGIASIATLELKYAEWDELFNDQETHEKVFKCLLNSSIFKRRLQQCPADASSGRNRLTNAMLFEVLSCNMVLSRQSVRTGE